MKFWPSCILILAFLTLATPLHAADLNKEGEEKVKSLVESFIAQQKKLNEIDGVTKIEYQGDVLVEQADGYYAVTLPYTKIINSRGEQIDLGMISVNAAPGDQPGQWKMRVAVPTPVIVTDKSGAEILRMTIGGQRAAGIWDESMQSFIKLDALYRDILFTGPDGTIKLPETQVIYDLTKDSAGKWSGPGSVTVKNIEAAGIKNNSSLKVAEVKAEFAIDQYNAAAIRLYREKLAALADNLNKDTPPVKDQDPATHMTAQASAIAGILMELLPEIGNGAKIRYDITNLQANSTDPATGAARSVNLPKAFFGFDIAGFTTGKLRLGLQAGYNGLAITPEPEQKALTPAESNIDVVIENIPLRDILDLAQNTLNATLQQPEMKQLAGISFMLKLPALLSQAGTFMTVSNAHIGNADIEIKLEGRARADISAVNSATVDAKATIRGLDLLLEKLKERQKTGNPGEQAKIQATISQLEEIKTRAKVEKTPDGQTLHILEFTMNPQGQMLLNGKDLQAEKAKEGPPGITKPAPVPAPAPAPAQTP